MVCLERLRILFQVTFHCTKPHGSSFHHNFLLLFHHIDHWIRSERIYFGGMSFRQHEHVSGKFHNGTLKSKADSKKWKVIFPCIFYRLDLSFYSPCSKTWCHEDAI